MTNTVIPAYEYAQGWSIPNEMGEAEQKEFIKKWASGHSVTHSNTFNLLNNLMIAIGTTSFKMDSYNLFFSIEDSDSVNKFLENNDFQHKEFYQWLGLLGAELANYAKPVMIFPAMLNPTTRMMRIDAPAFNSYMFYEKMVHNRILNSIHSLYTAYGV